jgi:uncharacterized PurR-regulated membrane protein YhhQ (DUF165 family)
MLRRSILGTPGMHSNHNPPAAGSGYSTAFLLVAVGFVVALIVSNIVSVKLAQIGPWVMPAGVIVFPVSYIIGDILTEVYGYRRVRQVIWLGFAFNLAAVGAIVIQWLAKSAYEALATPVTYWIVGALKRREGVDAFDRDIDFNPFRLRQGR